MATHSSTLAWKIPWTVEPGGLQSMGSQRVRHDWATSLSLFTFMHWRRKWQPTPVYLPGESRGRRSLVGCRLWDRTESDRLKRLSSSSSIMTQNYGHVISMLIQVYSLLWLLWIAFKLFLFQFIPAILWIILLRSGSKRNNLSPILNYKASFWKANNILKLFILPLCMSTATSLSKECQVWLSFGL